MTFASRGDQGRLHAFRLYTVIRKPRHRAALGVGSEQDAAETLGDLSALPGNPLEALKGQRHGQHSIRIKDQYRICFRWRDGDAYDAEITDYH